jgi:tRNA pseudouridine38-40 synthase
MSHQGRDTTQHENRTHWMKDSIFELKNIMTLEGRNIRLLIAYDGTRYRGWQRQKESPTIQGTIEKILFKITQQPVSLVGAGRTDSGVHAWGQVASFKTGSQLPNDAIKAALTALLPKDILIRQIEEVEPAFHARYSSRAKVYDYLIRNHPPQIPFFRHYVWFLPASVDLGLIKSGMSLLTGEHDFSSFQSHEKEVSHSVRTLYQAILLPGPGGSFKLRFMANGFLRHMVRNMVGILIRVGLKRIPLKELEEILHSRNRSLAGEMAPPQGLFLRKVVYRDFRKSTF